MERSGALGAEVLLERAQGRLQLGGVGVELHRIGAELRGRQPVDGVEERQSWRTCASALAAAGWAAAGTVLPARKVS